MQLTPAQIDNELHFWLGQDQEHCLFFALGFEEPTFHDEAKRLNEAYAAALGRGDLGAALQVLDRSQAFKLRARDEVRRGRWLGWIYPLFLDHTYRELEYMKARVQPGGLTARDELCFGDRINAEHCAFAAHLIDPSEQTAHNVVDGVLRPRAELAANACMTEVYPQLLALSKRSSTEIDRFFSGLDLKKTKSIIHPVLAAHVVREGQRFLQTIDGLPAAGPQTTTLGPL